MYREAIELRREAYRWDIRASGGLLGMQATSDLQVTAGQKRRAQIAVLEEEVLKYVADV